ncbi:MAG: transglutaminase domain-containing protein [Sporichthyaceae bacterium]
MTCRLVTPWWIDRSPIDRATSRSTPGSTDPTGILDWHSAEVQALTATVEQAWADPREGLRSAHTLISGAVPAAYALDDAQPASRTLRRGRGSCSQRMAVLEAVARANGTPSRVRGLLVDGRFWLPRFPRLRQLVPHAVVLAWPEFAVEDSWVNFSELFLPWHELPADPSAAFGNSGPQTLFDAPTCRTVDWEGRTSAASGAPSACDLSSRVLADLGWFDDRDELFARYGQTLCPPARIAGEFLVGRRRAA